MKRSFYRRPANRLGWSGLALLILWPLPLAAQEAAPIEPPPVQTVNSGSSDAATAPAAATEATVTVETAATATTTATTEPAATADTAKTAPAEGAGTDHVAAAVSLPSAAESAATATNVPEPAVKVPGLPAVTNSPPPDPRTGDTPGWWFEAALKQGGGYPMFLGVRFADASRAIIIETPNRKLTVGQPLVYRLWVCNDLPQPLECRVDHVIREKETVLVAAPEAAFSVNGSGVRNVSNFTQSTAALVPGQYTVEAVLRSQAGKVLHRYTEHIEILAKGQ